MSGRHNMFNQPNLSARRRRYMAGSVILVINAACFAGNVKAENQPKPDVPEISPRAQLEEVVVKAARNRPDTTQIDPATVRLFKVAGGSLDPLSSLYALPGVTNGGDFRSAPAVRGSSPEDNAYYIDFIPARYVFHVFGNSIFNENLIHKFDLYPAAFGSQYANATGAVIDVTLRDPKHERFTTTADWSFLLTGVMVESEVTPNQAFYASYRRSLIDKFYNNDDASDEDQGIAVDQLPVSDDYQIKHVWDASTEHSVAFVAAGANDKIGATFNQNSNLVLLDPDFAGAADVRMGFDSQGIVWNYDASSGTRRAKTLLTHSTDFDDIRYGTGQFIDVKAERLVLREHFSQQLASSHWLTLGVALEQADYDISVNAKIRPCGPFDAGCDTVDAQLFRFNQSLQLLNTSTYVEDVWQLSPSARLTAGLHFMTDDYLSDDATMPRLRLDYTLTDSWSVYVATGLYSQLPQLPEIADNVGNPNLEYVDARHYVIGAAQNLDDGWSWQIDTYLKTLDNVINSVTNPGDADYGSNYSNDASGKAYGVELLLNKKMTEKFYGWLSLSLAKTERHDDRTGDTRPFDYDRPFILNLVGNYQYDESWLFGMKWTIQSGLLYTPISDLEPSTTYPDTNVPVYGELNSERLPVYHRLDIRAEYKRPTSTGYWSAFVDLINAYDQKNIEGYNYAPNLQDTENSPPDGFGANVPVSAQEGFRFFPSLGFRIQF